MRFLVLPSLFLIITAVFLTTQHKGDSLVRDCQREENALYEKRWADRCLTLGFAHTMCKLPKEHIEEIGWENHVRRSQACQQ